MKFIILATFLSFALAVNGFKPEVRELHTHTEEVLGLTVKQENEIIDQLKDIHENNETNAERAAKLARLLNESTYCTAADNDGWNVIVLADSWYDRHTFHITSESVRYLAVRVWGLGTKEKIFVIFNEC